MNLLSNVNNMPMISEFFDDNWIKSRFSTSTNLPLVNVINTENNYWIEVAAPGFSKDMVNVTVENGILTVTGNNTNTPDVTTNNYTRQEFSFNSFSRSFTLPENCNSEEITAKFENGVLRLTIAKLTPETTTKREVAIV